MKSIAHRIYKAIFAISVVCVLLMISTVLIVNEDLEDTLLGDLAQSQHVALPASMDRSHPFIWDGDLNKVAYIPHLNPTPLPPVFHQIGTRAQAEIDVDGSTFLVNVEYFDEGTFYWARNIDAFERRESTLGIVLLVIVVSILILSFLLALYSSRKIVQPLQNLTQQIKNLPIDHEFAVLEASYQDRELNDIAETFNFFLTQLESYIQREKQLLNLASHELRTPIAVTAGALDVIEARKQLQPNDYRTLQRIRRANEEMENNVTILLQLARGTLHNTTIASLNLRTCVQEIIDDLATLYPAKERIQLKGETHILTHPSLVKMLLRNLIQNSLQHTTGIIHVEILPTHLTIHDEGTTTSEPIPWPTTSQKAPNSGGLGLYLVTLMCEKLEWDLKTNALNQAGTQVSLYYANYPKT